MGRDIPVDVVPAAAHLLPQIALEGTQVLVEISGAGNPAWSGENEAGGKRV